MPFKPLDRDQPNAIMKCLDCQTQWLIYEQQIGTSLVCPTCGSADRTRYQGTVGKGNGSQLSFSSFRRLLSEPDTSAQFVTLVEHLLDLRHEGNLCFGDVSGNVVGVEEAHYRIQGNEVAQSRMYNRAMSILR